MNAWEDTVLVGIYTITPLHLGSGQVSGAVDLPIARDSATGFPLIPATSIKGVARETIQMAASRDNDGDQLVTNLFGKAIDAGLKKGESGDESDEGNETVAETSAGQLCFSEARMIAYPARALNRPFLHITCPLILERLQRESRVFGIDFDVAFTPPAQPDKVWASVSDATLNAQPLVIEDLLVEGGQVVSSGETRTLAEKLAGLIAPEDQATRDRFIDGLVVLPDAVFQELISRIVPIRARTQLTGGKTTDKWRNEDGEIESGNLWYEEHLPSDCLFTTFVGARRHWRGPGAQGGPTGEKPVAMFQRYDAALKYLQIGGDETVGHGICYWRFAETGNSGGGDLA